MKTIAEGQNAISILDGRQVDGRLLKVKADGFQSKSVFGRPRRNSGDRKV
jgi:hypothetical protein